MAASIIPMRMTQRRLSCTSELVQQVCNGRLDEVKKLLERRADINCKRGGNFPPEFDAEDECPQTPLSWAAIYGHVEMVGFLLEQCAGIQIQDKYQQTPLSRAARYGYAPIVKLLLEKKAQRETQSCNDETPLSLASQKGHSKVVRLLLENRAEIDTQNCNAETPISLASQKGHSEVVQLLLENDAEIDTQNSNARTPLSLASQKGHSEVVQLLLENDAEIEREDKGKRTPLSWAVDMGHLEIVELLLENNAQIDAQNCNARTPLSLASQKGHSKVVRLLLKWNAEIEREDEGKRTPLSWAVDMGHLEIVELLLENDAQIDTQNCNARTPLSLASQKGHSKVVRLLLKRNAEIEREDEGTRTPLSWAVDMGHFEIVELLLEKNAQINYSVGQKLLPWAAKNGRGKIVELFGQEDAALEAKDDSQRTALSLAAEQGYSKVAQLLLEKRAQVEAGCTVETPLYWAIARGNLQTVNLLLEKKAKILTKTEYDHGHLSLAEKNRHTEVSVVLWHEHTSSPEWNVEELCNLIELPNQDVVGRVIEKWPKDAKQSRCRSRAERIRPAQLPERLRPVLAPNLTNLADISSDENCAGIIQSSNVEYLSQENLLWAPQVAVMLKVLPGVKGSDAINQKFLKRLADTPHERIFETDAMQAMILAAWQQERFSTWFEILSCLMMVISLCVSSYGFRHGDSDHCDSELMPATAFLYVAAVLHGKKSLNELVQLLHHLAKKCGRGFKYWKCSHGCLESWHSLSSINFDNWYSPPYMNFDNFADLIYIGSGWMAIGRQLSCPSNLEKPWMAMFCALSWLRLLYSLRGETWIGPRLLPILSAIKDTRAFFFIMTICIVAASHAYYNLKLREEPSPSYAAIMQIVRLGIFGDFDLFEFEGLDKTYIPKDADTASVFEPKDPDPGKHYDSVHALFYSTGMRRKHLASSSGLE